MNARTSFSNSTYIDQLHMEEDELVAFVGAVSEFFGREQAKRSAEDWLDEAELMDAPPLSTERDWRAVTVAASARVASRLNVGCPMQWTGPFISVVISTCRRIQGKY